MVGPSLSDDDRKARMSRLQAFVVLLVAGSGALVALYADASGPYVAGAALGGAIVGLALWYYLVWTYRDKSSRRDAPDTEEYEKRERFK